MALAGLAATLMASTTGLALSAEPAQADTLISIQYQHRNFGGDRINLWVSPSGVVCTPSTLSAEWQWPDLPDFINDEISSFQTFVSCRVKNYQNNNFGGVSTPWQTTQSYIGDAMNDRTSSVQAS